MQMKNFILHENKKMDIIQRAEKADMLFFRPLIRFWLFFRKQSGKIMHYNFKKSEPFVSVRQYISESDVAQRVL